MTQPSKALKSPRKEKYHSKWASWRDLRPVDDHYAGAIQGATARKHRHCHKGGMKKRVDRTQQQRETPSGATEANIKNHASNIIFQDRNLSKKIKIKEAEIDLILKTLLHVPHSSRSETTSPKTKMHACSGESTFTELSDKEIIEEMGSGLNQDNRLTKEELKIATIKGLIPTMMANSGASTTCIQPKEEQGQKSECG